MEEKIPDGYYIPAHKSLQEEILWAGVPREFMILNFTLCISIAVMLRIYLFFIVSLILYFVAKWMSKADSHFFMALVRHLNEMRYFDV